MKGNGKMETGKEKESSLFLMEHSTQAILRVASFMDLEYWIVSKEISTKVGFKITLFKEKEYTYFWMVTDIKEAFIKTRGMVMGSCNGKTKVKNIKVSGITIWLQGRGHIYIIVGQSTLEALRME